MEIYKTYSSLFIPHLVNYAVAIVMKQPNDYEVGSGVLVKIGSRHFVATAKHCIEGSIRVICSRTPLKESGQFETRDLRVLQKGWHDSLDIGYLEIDDPRCAELRWEHLSSDWDITEMAHFIGYPTLLAEVTYKKSKVMNNLSLCAGVFGTTLIEKTDDRMAFHFPKTGGKYNQSNEKWIETEFPVHPKGFSGGGCYTVSIHQDGTIPRFKYSLIGIDYAWNERDKVFAVPIQRWCELIVNSGLFTET